MRKDGTLSFLLGDHLGSSSLVTDASGNLPTLIGYYPWGDLRYPSGSLPTDYLYTGQRGVASIGLQFYNARWYDPTLGRFAQADSLIKKTLFSESLFLLGSKDNVPEWVFEPQTSRPERDERNS